MAQVNAWGHSELSILGGRVASSVDANDQTALVISATAEIAHHVNIFSAQSALVEGGRIGSYLAVAGGTHLDMTGGRVEDRLVAANAAEVFLTGGVIFGELEAHTGATIFIFGDDFELNGAPVGFGPLSFQPGTRPLLTGRLDSGDSLFNRLFIGQDQVLGSFILVPEPSTTILGSTALAFTLLIRANSRRLG